MSATDVSIVKDIRNAIKADDLDRVRSLIEADRRRLDIMTAFGTWLHVAASLGKLKIVKYLVSIGADVNKRANDFDAAPIKEAASQGHLEVVKYLISAGSRLDTSEPNRNPLFGAIYGWHPDVAKFLIDSGIDTRVKYDVDHMDGMDALAFAREWGRTDIANMILEAQKK